MRCIQDEFQPDTIFHIFNHATDDLLLFYDDQDYEYFHIALEKQLNKTPASIFAYCLMPNHYHFLIRQDDKKKIFEIFNYAFVSYARYYNKKYNRKGHIFRSPLQHKLVDNNMYLVQLCKYIHLNPVYAGLVDEPEEWEYSNYKEWINLDVKRFYCNEIREVYFPNKNDYHDFVNSFNFITQKGIYPEIKLI